MLAVVFVLIHSLTKDKLLNKFGQDSAIFDFTRFRVDTVMAHMSVSFTVTYQNKDMYKSGSCTQTILIHVCNIKKSKTPHGSVPQNCRYKLIVDCYRKATAAKYTELAQKLTDVMKQHYVALDHLSLFSVGYNGDKMQAYTYSEYTNLVIYLHV